MIYPMYCVRDVKTTFFPPQPAQNEEDAKRNFAMMVNNPSDHGKTQSYPEYFLCLIQQPG